jgi:ribosomal protein S18 acetylase RimI-like enzyme
MTPFWVNDGVGEIVVRRAEVGDYPSLQAIYRRASLGNDGDRAALLAHPEALNLSDDLISRGRTFVATSTDGTVIGFISTMPAGAGVLELEDLFVDPDFQRRGAARLLLDSVVAYAVRDNVRRLEVTANEHALGFYDAVGFENDGAMPTQLGAGTRMHLTLPF